MLNIEEKKLLCPFCNKGYINIIVELPVVKHRRAYGASTSKSIVYRTKERFQVHGDCLKCGKSQKEIQKALNEGKEDPEKDKRILERLKQQGLDFSNVETKL